LSAILILISKRLAVGFFVVGAVWGWLDFVIGLTLVFNAF